jgi:hypothetical protein
MVTRLAGRSPALIEVAVTEQPTMDRPSLPSGTLSLRQ